MNRPEQEPVLTPENGQPLEFFIVSKPEDIDQLPEGVQAIHLSQQRVTNQKTLRRLLERVPTLKVIQLAPSVFDFKRNSLAPLCQEAGVQLQPGLLVDREEVEDDQRNAATIDYLEKVLAFFKMTPEQRRILQRMSAVGMPEVQLAEKYFNPRKPTIREVAQEVGLSPRNAQIKIEAISHWLGIESKASGIQSRARNLEVHLRRLERKTRKSLEQEQKKARELEERRENFRIGDRLPPVDLPPERWRIWREIWQRWEEQPHLFLRLKPYPKYIVALVSFYQLSSVEEMFPFMQKIPSFDYPVTATNIADAYGKNKNTVYNWMKRALEKLEIRKGKSS